MAQIVITEAINALSEAGFEMDGESVVERDGRRFRGTMFIEAAEANGRPGVHVAKGRGKPSGRFKSAIRETLSAAGLEVL